MVKHQSFYDKRTASWLSLLNRWDCFLVPKYNIKTKVANVSYVINVRRPTLAVWNDLQCGIPSVVRILLLYENTDIDAQQIWRECTQHSIDSIFPFNLPPKRAKCAHLANHMYYQKQALVTIVTQQQNSRQRETVLRTRDSCINRGIYTYIITDNYTNMLKKSNNKNRLNNLRSIPWLLEGCSKNYVHEF